MQAFGFAYKRKSLEMRTIVFIFAYILPSILATQAIAAPIQRPDWGKIFEQYAAVGTVVLVDERQTPPQTLVFNPQRAQQRYSPASTYKIPHTLFALDAELVRDEFQIFPWDGVPRSFAAHNQNQTLRSAMRHSAVWVYEGFARQLGEGKATRYLQKIAYGNATAHTQTGDYWIDGDLAISAYEQVGFLRQLYHNALPFKLADQRLTKDVLLGQAEDDWILRAKTGWQGHYGWWVGWVEKPEGAVFFALNIDTPNRMDDLYKRQAIGRAVLQTVAALPPTATKTKD